MRKLLLVIIVLALLVLIGLTIYAYVADLPAPGGVVETPATGVGFGQ